MPLRNDSDKDEDELMLNEISSPMKGEITQDEDLLVYSISKGFVGVDSFAYTVSDGKQWLQFDSGNSEFNKAYEEQFLEKLTNLKKFCSQNQISFKTISTTDTLVKGF